MGVVVSWQWPDATAGITGEDFEEVAVVIRRGTPKKMKWRHDVRATDWVGKAFAQALKLELTKKPDKAQIAGLLKYWLEKGSLMKVREEDENREMRDFVVVTEEEGE